MAKYSVNANDIAEVEKKSSRAKSIFLLYVILGEKNLKKLTEILPKNVTIKKVGIKTEIMTLRKNARILMKSVIAFFKENDIKKFDKNGNVRFYSPFAGETFSNQFIDKHSLARVSNGIVFKSCAEKYEKTLEPEIALEDREFKIWDDEVNKILSDYIEKKQIKAKKWLELTTPVLRNPSISGTAY